MKIKLFVSTLLFVVYSSALLGNDTLQVNQEMSELEYQLLWKSFKDSINNTFVYETGEVQLKGNMAKINVPSGFKYLNGKDSEMILTDIWGNPPSTEGNESLGMLIPADKSPLEDSTYSINITYSAEGYVDDEDAKDIDYDELLESMQEDMLLANEERVSLGYLPIKLLGWASPPFYDSETKKLHWAKELKFGDYEENTLNYNIRILGRKGYLQLNAIGEMYIVDEVKGNIQPILDNVSFTSGNSYADFNPDIDQVAAYGIGGLIAGKVLAKAGFFAILAKFWKVIMLAIIGFGASILKFFRRDKPKEEVS